MIFSWSSLNFFSLNFAEENNLNRNQGSRKFFVLLRDIKPLSCKYCLKVVCGLSPKIVESLSGKRVKRLTSCVPFIFFFNLRSETVSLPMKLMLFTFTFYPLLIIYVIKMLFL